MQKAMITALYTIPRGVRFRLLLSALLFLCGAGATFAQDLRTRDLLLDDDASTTATRNTITLRSPADASLLNDYVFRLPNSNGLAAGAMLYVESYAGSTAVTRWLAPGANSVLTSDANGTPVWQNISALVNVSQEWIDGDSIGVPGVIYAAQALQSGTADTVVVTDAGRIGVGTATPGGLVTVRGSGSLLRGEESDGTLRSVLYDDGEQDWYLGGMTGEVGQGQVGTTSGFPSFSLYRPGGADRFDILNHSTYAALGFNADGAAAGNVLTIEQGGNVGIGLSNPTAKLHVSATSDPLRLEGLVQNTVSDSVLVVNAQGVVGWASAGNLLTATLDSSIAVNAWLLTGNSGTNPSANFLGTTDAQGLAFRTNNAEAVRIGTNGFVGIGTSAPQEKLHLNGGDIRMDNQAGHTIEMRSTVGTSRPIGDVRFYENDTTWFGSFSYSGDPNMFYFTAGSGAGDVDTLMAIDGQGTNKGYVGIGLAPATDAALRSKLQVQDGNILLSNTGSAGELRFEEPSPGGQNYTAFRAGAQSADITYVLPDTIGIVGDVLRVASVAGSTATLDWGSGSSGSGSSGTAWLLTGNASTNPSNNFLGTTDNTALEIRVNNARALRFDPRTASPNITGGYSGNYIPTNQDGNVIAGGGVSGATNQIGSGVNYGFIGGGANNQVQTNSVYGVVTGGYNNRLSSTSDRSAIVGGEAHQIDNTQYSFIGGGNNNRMSSDADYSTIAGGRNHQIDNGQYSFIGGGYNNRMSSDADYSTIAGGNNGQIDNSKYAFLGGGDNNRMNSDADYSAIGAGNNNQISNGEYALIGSGTNNQLNSNADYSAIVAGSGNQVSGGQYATIGGGSSNIIGYNSNYSFIGSGSSNQVSSASDRSAIAGGGSNQIDNTQYGFIGSGSNNRLTSDADYSAVVGGQNHQIDNGQYIFIGGGNNNRLTSDADYSLIAGGNGNQIDNSKYSLTGGGNNNRMTSGSDYSVIAGGSNIQLDNSDYAFVGSGASIQMSNSANYAVVAGGQSISLNNASYAAVAGGQSNTVNNATHASIGGGQTNTASGSYGVISGGQSNTITGSYSTIAGGRGLTLSGSRSFGFLGGNTGSNNMSISSSDIAVFGNTDMWLANNDNSASQLRFYEPNSVTGSFPGSANYTALRAQAQAQDIEYIFPDTAGAVGDVLVVKAKSGTQVTLDWSTTNEASAVGKLLFARKTANETVSGTTLQNDDHLILALEAGKAYEVRGTLYCERASGSSNLNLAWTVPGGTGTGTSNSTMLIAFYAFERKNSGNRDIGGDTRTQSGTGAPDGAGEVGLSTNLVVVTITGMIITGTTAGNLTLQWAPTTGGGDQVRLLANSFMSVTVAQ